MAHDELTYREVGSQTGLTGDKLDRYVCYMRTRWPRKETEKRHCEVGYAQDWAYRFLYGQEYAASALDGQLVLTRINALAQRPEEWTEDVIENGLRREEQP